MNKCALCQRMAEPFETVCRVCRNNFYSNLTVRGPVHRFRLGFPILSASIYRGITRNWLWNLKTEAPYNQNIFLNTWMSKLVDHWTSEIRSLNAELIVSVPSNPWRVVMERSLSCFLGELVSQKIGIPHEKNILSLPWTQVMKKWGQQKQKNKYQRLSNSHRFFENFDLKTNLAKNRKVLLVDDICTTGATLKSCSEKLNQGGIPIAGAFVLAHVENLADYG